MWYIITMKEKAKNQVATTKMNIAAAVLCSTLRDAEVHFRALQHANGRGTTESQYSDLGRAWRSTSPYERKRLEPLPASKLGCPRSP